MPKRGDIIPPAVRFEAKTVVAIAPREGMDTACVEWSGARDADGYGIFQLLSRKSVKAHRWIYAETAGPIPEGGVVRHRCDNPPCVNVEHLIAGTHAQNVEDRTNRRRDSAIRGEQHHAAKMTQGKVDELMSRKAAGESIYGMYKEFGISYAQAKAIVAGRKWKPLP